MKVLSYIANALEKATAKNKKALTDITQLRLF